MANLFEQYGIKEVADVTLYQIAADGITEVPYLFLDSLKVSTVEQTAEQAEARGGKGNSPLIIWDYGKEINITITDALYSPKSMALMFGGKNAFSTNATATVTKFVKYRATASGTIGVITPAAIGLSDWEVQTVYPDSVDAAHTSAATTVAKGEIYLVECTKVATHFTKLEIKADEFPGTFKLVGDTVARNKNTGSDEYFQFIINRAKMSAEETLTLEAEGDPTTFNFNMRVLRPDNGIMMELIQYDFN